MDLKNKVESGVLYIVSTPIGNLKDITLRALDILKEASIIFAEDTRVSRQLLQKYAITPPKMLSCHEHNEKERISQIITALDNNEVVVLVSDAGTPLISDPGFIICQSLREKGYKIVPIPGVSALITALSASGLPSDAFQFRGFFPVKNTARLNLLNSIKPLHMTHIFYESTHRITSTLESINKVLGDRCIVVAKELTKQYENFFIGNAAEIQQKFNDDPLLCKGEFVILIQGEQQTHNTDSASIDSEHVLSVLLRELPLKQAVKLASDITGLKKNNLYKKALALEAHDK